MMPQENKRISLKGAKDARKTNFYEFLAFLLHEKGWIVVAT